MGFPIKTAIKQVEGVEPLRVGGERGSQRAAFKSRGRSDFGMNRGSIRGFVPFGLRHVKMAFGIVHRVRLAMARDIRIRREHGSRSVAACAHWSVAHDLNVSDGFKAHRS
jgi:hypothetical protein